MRRGEVWTASAGAGYVGKPRPVVILQDDHFDATASVTICAFTTDPTDAPLFRVVVEPTQENGLQIQSRLMADKITTVARGKLGKRIGRLREDDMARLGVAAMLFLGLASGGFGAAKRASSSRTAGS